MDAGEGLKMLVRGYGCLRGVKDAGEGFWTLERGYRL